MPCRSKQPSPHSGSGPKEKVFTVAAILNLEHAHGQGILRGIAHAAHEEPKVRLLRFSHTRLQARAWLASLPADGLIVKVTTATEAALLEADGRPVIDVGAECAQHGLARVTTDDTAVGEMAAGYFLRRGFRQLAFAGILGHGASAARGEGFARTALNAGLSCAHFEDAFNEVARLSRAAVDVRLGRWLESLPTPVGIFCTEDPLAARVADTCVASGRRVPEDIAVLGCNNDLTEVTSGVVAISSIELSTERIGQEALHQMRAWLATGRRSVAAELFRPVKIVTRRSSERFAVADEAIQLALEFIHERRAGTFGVADVAHAAGISRRLLEMRFRRHLGFSIHEEVQRLRLERAIGLMSDRERRLTDVAREAGFSSLAKLSSAFRVQHGLSPSAFRRAHFGANG